MESQFYKRSLSKSGATVLTEEIPHVKSVALGFWIRTGSRDESESLSGVSHFLEHLLFKGTKTRTAKDISEAFDSIGGEINAFTSKEYTCFYAHLLDQYLPVGIEVISDMLQNSLFRKKDINSERKVVLEEINLHEDSPDEKIHDLFAHILWKKHPLGKSVLGKATTVGAFTQSDIQRYFSTTYVPEDIVITAAGNLEHQRVLKLVNKLFTPDGERPNRRKQFVPSVESHFSLYKKDTEQAHICYGTQGLHAKSKDRFALALLDIILGGGMSSHLFQEVREKRGLVYSVFSYHALHSDTGLIAIYAGTSPSKVKPVIQIIQEELRKMIEYELNPEELRRAKEHLKGQLLLGLESTSRRMMRLARAELNKIKILSLDELVKRIEQVTSKDIHRIAKNIFKSEKMVLTILGPVKDKKTLSKLQL